MKRPSVKTTRRSRSIKRVAAALILRRANSGEDERTASASTGDLSILICQRTRHQPFPLKWEFPGGKIEPGEQPRDALRRELDEELGIDATIGDEITRIQHTYSRGGTVELRFFVVNDFAGQIENRIFKDVRWVALQELPKFDFLEADAGLVEDIAAGRLLNIG
ncbi:MAG: (deoxy)nucleoside triphosphate pyrophosphohydrolase [Acidobacteriia bacterium]|nr:(deoxy)nucleoside triphosphate pyrophosphohydrolase [Terriglobia bacterium]